MSDASAHILSIRECHSEEESRLHSIDQVCFPAGIAFSRRELLFHLTQPGSVSRVAEYDGNIIGFAVGRVHANRTAHVLTLDVLPEARRQKIGTLLMRSLHDEFKNRSVELVVLEVSTTNASALRLYTALHYEVVETLSGYYNGCDDAYRMIRVL